MEVCEKNLAFSQKTVFGGQWFLYFYDEFGLLKDLAMISHHCGASLLKVSIRVARARAGVAFDQHLMPAFDQLVSRRRQQRDAVFLNFNLFWYTNNHKSINSLIPLRAASPASAGPGRAM